MGPSAVFSSGILAAVLLVSGITLPVNQAFGANSFPTGITFFTTEKLYTLGERVTVKGQIHSSSLGNPMLLNVYSPDQQPYYSNRLDSVGAFFELSFLLDKAETRVGQWKVVALYSDMRAETTFTLVNGNEFEQIILGKPVLVDGITGQVAPENQRAGRTLAITAGIESDEDYSQRFVFVAQVLDSTGTPVQVSFVTGSVRPGETVSPLVNWSPKEAGVYVVEVFVWDSLQYPVALVDKQIGIFGIS